MNEKTAYEQIISGKLQALPVPDMADAIWARIEAQLDLDMPDTDLPPDNTTNAPTGGTIIAGISALFVITLISFFLLKKNNNKPSLQQPATPSTTLQKENKTFEQTSSKTKTAGHKVKLPPVTTVLQPSLTDSSSAASLLPITANDSTTTGIPVAVSTQVVLPQKQDTLLPVKKGRGVTGIKDDDYRVVPKKDSVNKN